MQTLGLGGIVLAYGLGGQSANLKGDRNTQRKELHEIALLS